MPKATQLTISVANRPGTMAHVARVLGDAKVDIQAFLTTSSGSAGSVEVVVDNANRAKKALDGEGLSYTEQAVLHVELPNKPGALGHFAGKLAAKGVNVSTGYATTIKGARKASIVLAVSDLEAAARIR
ncbi:MAG: ACT domain-containing protein [Terriglobales bacterium]